MKTAITPAALLLGLTLATPAFAQHHARGNGGSAPAQSQAVPRGEAARPQPRTYQRSAPQRVAPPQTARVPPQTSQRPLVVPPQVGRRAVVPPARYAVPRPPGSVPPRYDGRRYDYRDYRYRPHYSYSRPLYRGGVIVSPFHYVFRPRVRLAFGIYVGYPFAYPYTYPYYPYAAPVYNYGYPGSIGVAPGAAYGGISLQISPADADVFVDGTYVGRVEDFYDPARPLTLAAGRHRIELQAPGYVPWTFDVDVVPGQLIPYQGELQPY